MNDPTVFLGILAGIFISSLVFAFAFLIAMRVFGCENLEFRPTFFVCLMAHILVAGLSYLIIYVLGRQKAFQVITLGTHEIPTTLVAFLWLMLIAGLFLVVMLKIAGKTSFGAAFGVIFLGGLVVLLLAALGGVITCLTTGCPFDQGIREAMTFLRELPERVAGNPTAAPTAAPATVPAPAGRP